MSEVEITDISFGKIILNEKGDVLLVSKDDSIRSPRRSEGVRRYSLVEEVVKEDLNSLETAIKILLLVQTSIQWAVDRENGGTPDSAWTPEQLLTTVGQEIGRLKFVAKYGWADSALPDDGKSAAIPNWRDYLNERELAREKRRSSSSD